MFISPAFAQGGGGVGGADLNFIFVMVLIFGIFYLLVFRPQQKRAKQHREMLGSIRRGDKIVTGGGVIGTVTKVVNDNELAVEIAEGVKIRVLRSLVSQVLSKTEPAGGAQPGGGDQGGGSLLSKLFGGR